MFRTWPENDFFQKSKEEWTNKKRYDSATEFTKHCIFPIKEKPAPKVVERNDEDMEDGTDYGSESEREHQICMLVREMEEQAQKERERKEQERLAKLDPVVELEKKIRETLRSR
ncbi:hypothetical protein Ptr902_04141 [Pyrenophora tritici-repentis]|nr:hypothetical protein Ptr902_04141 [Pyrenophora tritici-repentis]